MKPWPWLQPAEKAAPTAEQVLRRFRAKRSRAEGRRGEALVEHRLRALGIAMVERINVERLQVGGKALFKKRVSGDFRGIIPWTGRSVLVEVKLRPDTLSRSDLEKHQHAALWEHQCMGGLSLVAWVRGIDVFILTYKGFLADCSPGEPLTVEKARTLQITKPLANPT